MRIGNYLASATTLVIVGVTTLLVGVLITEEHHRALDAKRSAASMFTELFASSLSALVVFDDRDEVHKDLDNLRKTEGVVAAAIWLPNAPAPVASFGPNLEQSGPEVEITADRMIVTRPVVDREHDTIATVRIAFSLEAENALMAATTRSLLVGGAIVTAAVIALLNGLTRRLVVQPLGRLANVAARIEQGDLRARAEGTEHGEIGTLARAFNKMGDAIEERAEDLSISNERLKGSLEELRTTQERLVDASRKAGMADVATTVLHNVGNVLNSVNISASVVAKLVRSSRGISLSKAVQLIQSQPDPARFLSSDPRGVKLIDYFAALADTLASERADIARELEGLTRNIEHIKIIVSAQQSHAKVCGVIESTNLSKRIDDVLAMNAASTERHEIEIVRDYAVSSEIDTDPHKLLQILINLVSNARHALRSAGPRRRLIVRTRSLDADRVTVEVEDSGVGIAPENLGKIFNLGFTTKSDGHGYGLHFSACAAIELGGSLRAESDGEGAGAKFVLELPIHTPQKAAA